MAVTKITITAAGTGTIIVPSGVTNIRRRAWGGGENDGKQGGNGGAFAGDDATGIAVTPGQTIYYAVPAGSGPAWINVVSNALPTTRAQGVMAAGASNTNPGQASNSLGDIRYSGGFRSGTTGGGGAGSQGDAVGQAGGPPDGGDGGLNGLDGQQPGGGGGAGGANGDGMVEIEYGDLPVDAGTIATLTLAAPVLSAIGGTVRQGRAAFFRQIVEDPYVALITVSHPTLEEPIRAVMDTRDLVSQGQTFKAGKAMFSLPSRGQGDSRASVTIANVDARIALAAQSLVTPAEFLFQIVNAERPDIVEIEWPPMELVNVGGDVLAVTGDLTSVVSLLDQYPNIRLTLDIAPGLAA
jgi:hypothetical protein